MAVDSRFIELRAEEVQELLTREPTWFLQWSITLLAMLLAAVLYGSWLIRMPDLVQASFTLTTVNAPKTIVVRHAGRLMKLLVRENQVVTAGVSLAYLESIAHHEQILLLRQRLNEAWVLARAGQLEQVAQLPLADFHELGELQNAYQPFALAHLELQTYLAKGFFARRRALLHQEVSDLRALSHNLEQQRDIQGKELVLAETDYRIQQQLAQQKVIPPRELRQEESKMLTYQLPYRQAGALLLTNLAAQRVKQQELLTLEKELAGQIQQYLQVLSTLQSAADEWEHLYILRAPCAGHVYFPTPLQENQQVSVGQELFYVAPGNTVYIGQIRVPQKNAGKVMVGQSVLIRFHGYPYQEFGLVRGKIKAIAAVPLREGFVAEVSLPEQLVTTQGHRLAYKVGMTASAEIVTHDRRLLERLFNNLTAVLQ